MNNTTKEGIKVEVGQVWQGKEIRSLPVYLSMGGRQELAKKQEPNGRIITLQEEMGAARIEPCTVTTPYPVRKQDGD